MSYSTALPVQQTKLSTPTTERPPVLALVQAWREKNNVTLAKPDDPLATDKIRVERYLRRYGLTPDVLPSGYWDFGEDLRGFLLGQAVGPVMTERRAAKRLKRMMARGYPADYYLRSDQDRQRTSDVVRQRRSRAKKAAVAAAKPKPTPRAERGIPFEAVSREWRDDRLRSLTAWTAGSGPCQCHLRGHEPKLVKAALLYQVLASELRRAPSYGELADKFGCTSDAARNMVRRLQSLYRPTGPWHSKKRDGVCQVKRDGGVSGTEPPDLRCKLLKTTKISAGSNAEAT
jgi:hypothetical protein